MSHTGIALLAGVPRSGTTLACELLNKAPNTVALDEPMDVELLTGHPRRPGVHWARGDEPPDQELICDRIERFLDDMRHSILFRKTAISHQIDGQISGARMSDDYGVSGIRTALATRDEIKIEKPLSEAFLLVAKHPAAFTAIVGALVKRFSVFAVIRNPLFVLASWQTVPILVRDGHHPVAERIDPRLGEALAGIDDTLDRQLHLLGWFFGRLREHLPERAIIRYESIVATGGSALSAVTTEAAGLRQPLDSRNETSLYGRERIEAIGEKLLASDGPYWEFYPRQGTEDLLTST